MTKESEINMGDTGNTLSTFAKHAIAIQSEVSEKLIEASRHCLDQIEAESTEALELFRKFHASTLAVDRVNAIQDWFKGAAERGVKNANYVVETARALGEIESNLFTRTKEEKKAA